MSKRENKPEALGRVIEQAKQELERMIDAHPQGMCLASKDGLIQRVNHTLLQLLGLSSYADVIGKRFRELLPTSNPPEALRTIDELFAAQPAAGDPYVSRQLKVKLRKGEPTLLGLTLVSSGANNDLAIVIVEDLTRQEAESLQQQKRIKMEAAEAVVGALMHTINQHLTVITIRSQLLQLAMTRANPDPEAMRKGLEEITNLATQIADILRQAQTFKDYVTVPYLKESDIVDLQKSTGE